MNEAQKMATAALVAAVVEPHPEPIPEEFVPVIDFEKLQRGDTIPEETLCRHLGIYPRLARTPDEVMGLQKQFNFAVLTLIAKIEDYFERERGDTVSIIRSNNDLVILTPEQQDRDAARKQTAALRSFRRQVRKDACNRASELSDQTKREREFRLLRRSWQLQQLRKRGADSGLE